MWKMTTAAVMAAGLLGMPAEAEACSCVGWDIVQGYRNSDHVVAGRVLRSHVVGGYRVYDVWVWQTAKSCLTERTVVQIGTSRSSAACGAGLQVGGDYVLFANDVFLGGQDRMITHSCLPNTLAANVAPEDYRFLASRPMDCPTQECSGDQPVVSCFADPCTVTTCGDPTAECEANYCGGCGAEWYAPDDSLSCWIP